MSATCPLELLKAHAVISRSWLRFPKVSPTPSVKAQGQRLDSHEILRWYGREAHPSGFPTYAPTTTASATRACSKAFSPAAARSRSRDGRRVSSLQRRHLRRAVFLKCLRRNYRALRDRLQEDADIPYLEIQSTTARRSLTLTLPRHGYVPHRQLTAIPTDSELLARDSSGIRPGDPRLLSLAGRVHA